MEDRFMIKGGICKVCKKQVWNSGFAGYKSDICQYPCDSDLRMQQEREKRRRRKWEIVDDDFLGRERDLLDRWNPSDSLSLLGLDSHPLNRG